MICWDVTKGSGITEPINKIKVSSIPRSLCIDFDNQNFYTCNRNGLVDIWDTQLIKIIKQINLEDDLIPSVWNQEHRIALVGATRNVYGVDARSKFPCFSSSSDDIWGIRSISTSSNIITIGTGSGQICFRDIRKPNFNIPFYQTTKGYTNPDSLIFEQDLLPFQVPFAVYTHAYDEYGKKLFVGGGPTISGVSGAYASIWS